MRSVSAITAIGPIGYDDVQTPAGTFRGLLGGSAVFFGLAAAALAPARIVAAVGSDLRAEDLALLAAHGIDVSAVRRVAGRSHRWVARYADDRSPAETLENDLGVMAGWTPPLPSLARGDLLFIGSLEPAVQLALVRAAPPGVYTVVDTQPHWIAQDRPTVLEAMRRASLVCVNQAEATALGGAAGVDDAAGALLGLGCGAVVVKLGMRGAALYGREGRWTCGAAATRAIGDPTGAGDSFAGGVAGHLATQPARDLSALASALPYGAACASLRLELPAGERVRRWTREEIGRRAASVQVVRT